MTTCKRDETVISVRKLFSNWRTPITSYPEYILEQIGANYFPELSI